MKILSFIITFLKSLYFQRSGLAAGQAPYLMQNTNTTKRDATTSNCSQQAKAEKLKSYACFAHPNVCMVSRFSPVQLFVTAWTVARQAPLCIGFPRQEYGVDWHFLLRGSSEPRVKNMPAMQETRVQSLGQEDPLE